MRRVLNFDSAYPKMSLTQEQIAHIARLSKLKPSPEELEKSRENLSSVVEYVDQLSRIPASALEGIEISSPLICPLREDSVVSQ
jgi:aspartyl/glutamyl-tRNA(Asn/Gln) amidotransferase C subunit